ncbi:MAG TPA: hypothetical protein VFW29_02495 [Solirubrobacteraceae bacterium]|nr:hypothetical protein [Solirubrobacteraceae bacterium]
MGGNRGAARPVRRLAWTAVLLCCTLLVACGKTSPHTVTTVVARGSTAAPPAKTAPPSGGPKGQAPGEPKGGGGKAPPSDAQARSFAAAVNLRAGDLPGFTATSRSQHKTTPAEESIERELASCAGGLGNALGSGEEASPQFKRKVNVLQVSVSSNVSFLPKAASADAQLKVLRSPHTRDCLGSYLRKLLSQSRAGAQVTHVGVTQGTPPAPGSAGGFGWRLTAVFTVKRLNVPFYLDILGFLYKRAEVTLVSTGEALPFPAAIEERLFEMLLSRALSHAP